MFAWGVAQPLVVWEGLHDTLVNNMEAVHFVTALFDIGRATRGDGRGMDDYLDWLEGTLRQLHDAHVTLYLDATLSSHVPRLRAAAPPSAQLFVVELPFAELPLAADLPRMRQLVAADAARPVDQQHMRHHFMEFKVPEYSALVNSKIRLVRTTADAHEALGQAGGVYVWVDAGLGGLLNPGERLHGLSPTFAKFIATYGDRVWLQASNDMKLGLHRGEPLLAEGGRGGGGTMAGIMAGTPRAWRALDDAHGAAWTALLQAGTFTNEQRILSNLAVNDAHAPVGIMPVLQVGQRHQRATLPTWLPLVYTAFTVDPVAPDGPLRPGANYRPYPPSHEVKTPLQFRHRLQPPAPPQLQDARCSAAAAAP